MFVLSIQRPMPALGVLNYRLPNEVKMSKINIDIEYIKEQLQNIGYEISDCIERKNNGINWQLKFCNSGAVVSIYDSNRTKTQ